MSDMFDFHQGDTPLLVSVPHDGRRLPDELRARMTDAGQDIPDTDWHVAELYSFVREMGASTIVAEYSRYVIDLNRPASDEALYDGQLATGLCPLETFSGRAIYRDDVTIDVDEKNHRIEHYWRPYHDKLASMLNDMRDRHGYALLWDAHSIPSRVPSLFEGELPVLNIGSFDNRACDPRIVGALMEAAGRSRYSAVCNGRFKGGYITRHHGDPQHNVHAVQLELAQRAYMDEARRVLNGSKVSEARIVLRAVLDTYLAAAKRTLQ